jgi:hypothetical protein
MDVVERGRVLGWILFVGEGAVFDFRQRFWYLGATQLSDPTSASRTQQAV